MNEPIPAEIVEGWNPREETTGDEHAKRIAEIRSRKLPDWGVEIDDPRFDLLFMHKEDKTVFTKEGIWHLGFAVKCDNLGLLPETVAQADLAIKNFGADKFGYVYYPKPKPPQPTLTDRQQALEALGVTRELPAAHRLIVVDYELLLQRRGAVVIISKDGSKPDLVTGVKIHGEMWLVPYEDHLMYCGSGRENRMAIETFAPITTY